MKQEEEVEPDGVICCRLVGLSVGGLVGLAVGGGVGGFVGLRVLGRVGLGVGFAVGLRLGLGVGFRVGRLVGRAVAEKSSSQSTPSLSNPLSIFEESSQPTYVITIRKVGIARHECSIY